MARYDRKDMYHQRAKSEGYRSRAAYKLEEIQRRARILKRGARVFDLGCWPGGWLQVAAQVVGPKGRVVGVDIAELDPPLYEKNVSFLCADLTEAATADALLELLGRPADVVICDAAPKLTGVRATDRAQEEALLEAIEALVPRLLRPGGDLLVKLLECPEAQAIEKRLCESFDRSRSLKPKASRKGTSERYLVGHGFR
ncbi:MAG: RlmE family RNA methyltransferase [Deltaproteobacteria bacterium]|nr:RlmE family RNA methyltransferase [Deltaproteobacteria bacterium]MBW2360848.1 RlmE family RNA methyltransferase [Deltaproteobacteria bacterium]